jgi:predicted TIM-barrel fold metal-dependent hydrolase
MLIEIHAHIGRVLGKELQDKLMFGTDCCRRSDTMKDVPSVVFFKRLQEERKLPKTALDKIASENAIRLLGL